jgi:simple sugar transport system permease protein/D-ribose pyranase
MAANNPVLLDKVKRIFPDADHAPIPHADILGSMAQKAKVIVRTGAFDPWGNILLYSGVDAPKWFSKPQVVTPEEYKRRMK